jgi:DNA gyrase subunit A
MSNGNVLNRTIQEMVRKNKMDYSYNINLFRSFPDVNDGLKVVHRRILFAMDCLNLKGLIKSAAVVGKTLSDSHPHSDSSVYDAAVNMTQDFYMNVPLLSKSGNLGSISGDAAASQRYTEIGLAKYGKDCLDSLHSNSVNWEDNYLGTMKEPLTLPVKYPNLLINGSFGIGQAYIASIPPHNIKEVLEMTKELINNPELDLEYIAEKIRPDYPTGAVIINEEELKQAYMTGYGNIKVRAGVIRDEENNQLIFTSIPYMTTVNAIKDKILDCVKAETIKDISNIEDLTSTKNGVRLVIKAKRGSSLAKLETDLFKYTQLQSTLLLSLLCTENNETFRYYNIKELFEKWIAYRKMTLKRVFTHDMSKSKKRIHIIDGLLSALNDIDLVVKIAKSSNDKNDCIKRLLKEKKFNFTELQARYISEMQIYKLSKLSTQELIDEKSNLDEKVQDLFEYFTCKDKLNNFIIKQLDEGIKKYGSERKTTFATVEEINENNIEDKNYTIFITKNNYIKKVSLDINTQNKGGKGRSCGKLRSKDYIIFANNVNNKDNLLLFTNTGRVFTSKVYGIESCNLNALGFHIKNVIDLKENETIVTAINLTNEEINSENNLIFVTKKGLVKKTTIDHYDAVQKSGLIALKINEGDELIKVLINKTDDEEMVLTTRKGKIDRFCTDDIPLSLRVAMGVKGIDLAEEDDVIGADIIKEEDNFIFVITSNGKGKKVLINEITKTKRGVKGIMIAKLRQTDSISNVAFINQDSELTIITLNKMIKIKAENVSTLLRAAQGDTIVKLEEDDFVKDIIID